MNIAKAKQYLIEKGYDGVVSYNEEYIAFYPEQIKSVDNQGTFDSNNPNIYYQKNMPTEDYYENPTNNFVLPDLKNEDLKLLNKPQKPLVLKKNIVEKIKIITKKLI